MVDHMAAANGGGCATLDAPSPTSPQKSRSEGGDLAPVSREPLRVVFFTASYFVLDGVTLTIRKILAALKLAGAETLVITAAPLANTCGELGALEDENLVLVPGMPVPMEEEHYGYALGLGLSRDARKRLEEFKPHVAHFTVCDLLGMDGVKWAKDNNVATVGTWHSNYCDYVKFYSAAWWLTPVLRRYIQQFYGAIPTTYVPTDFMRLKLTAEVRLFILPRGLRGLFPSSNLSSACIPLTMNPRTMLLQGYARFTEMKVWGRGIDLDRFNPGLRRSAAFRRAHGVRDEKGEILIIWVGRLVPEKRPDIWRDVFKRVGSLKDVHVKKYQ